MTLTPIPIDDRPSAFQTHFNLEFHNTALITEALRASGVIDREGNKSLAHIGDTVLQLSLQLEGRARRATREQINYATQQIAANVNLTKRGFALGIDAYIWNNPSQGNSVSPKVMATTMEAIIGAAFLDMNRDMAEVQSIIDALGLVWPE
ncbi:ribonuclease III domain-containing protein [Aspergillus cavernicola]|uniref:Ribonuclease III domain-containing protein n=1 Tax=Aspergillus cavernicola TaxID=176166 RepID=A0ABR4HR75_9EURO